MPIERPPRTPLPVGYVPPGGIPYKVKTNDDLGSVARANGITEKDLVYFNFKTTDSAEINWYLRRSVGCVSATHDQKNWMFTSEARPGIIYIPPKTGLRPAGVAPEVSELDAWLGLGMSAGTQFVVVGIETLVGWVFSLDELGKSMGVGASVNRIGPGWGATGGVCVIYITGVSGPERLVGYQDGGWDFNLALGANWGKAAEATSKIKKLKPLIDELTKIGGRTPSTLKRLLNAEPKKWEEMITRFKELKDAVKMGTTGEPQVLTFGLPWPPTSFGVEVSFFYKVANFGSARWDYPPAAVPWMR
jgi:hypothetical protein